MQLWWILNLSWPEKLNLCSHLTEFTHLYWVINLHPLVQKGPILGHCEVSCAAYIAYIGLRPSLTSSFPRAFKFIGANSPLACLFYCFFFLPLLITTITFIFPFNTYAVQCVFESAERICLTLWQGRLYFHERIKKKKNPDRIGLLLPNYNKVPHNSECTEEGRLCPEDEHGQLRRHQKLEQRSWKKWGVTLNWLIKRE